MALTTARAGAMIEVTDSVAASSTSAVAQNRNVWLGPTSTAPTNVTPLSLTIGTGTALSANVILDGTITIGASATTTIDLTSFGGKTLAKVRHIIVLNANAAETGANYVVTLKAAASNGFTASGALTTTGVPIAAASQFYINNMNIAGWATSGSVKDVSFTAGSGGATVYFAFIGE